MMMNMTATTATTATAATAATMTLTKNLTNFNDDVVDDEINGDNDDGSPVHRSLANDAPAPRKLAVNRSILGVCNLKVR